MKIKPSFTRYQTHIYTFLLVLISFSVNQYYAYSGVLPVDSFSTFNAGYDILNGSLPFKDFWAIKGPVLDIIQALYFKIFGVSWISYTFHSSSFNSIFALATFFTLRRFKLELKYAFLYSLLSSILMYPTYGIPFTDHHVAIFSILAVYSLCLAIKLNQNIYWILIPLFLFLGFLTKQTPAGYFGVLISFITILYLIKNFRLNIILIGSLSSLILIVIFFFLLFFYKIPLESFIVQYLLFPISLGETRIEWLLPFEFQRFVLRHKLIYIALSIPIFLLFKGIIKNFFSILDKDNLVFLLLFGTLLIFITHQLMTINGLFIFFLIPVFAGFSHKYSEKFKKKKLLVNFFMILSLVSTIYYHQKYVTKRDTLLLRDVNLNNAVDSLVIDQKLQGLKWITHHYPNNPNEEIKNLLEAISEIKKDTRKKMLVTDYQFISVILDINDNSAARIWWRHHIYPEPNKVYFEEWKSFLISKILKENIELIYTIKPLEGEENIFDGLISSDCYSTNKINEILIEQKINDCKELRLFLKNKQI